MTGKEFRERLINELQGRMPDTVIFPKDIRKNNGVVFSNIIIQDNSSNAAPCICTEGLYYEYQNGHKDMDGVIDSVLELYGKIKPERDFNVFEILDYSKACHNLKGKLINTEKNRELLKELPHREFFDLSLVYFVDVTGDGNLGCASVKVENGHLEKWDVTEDDLYRQFKENMGQDDRSELLSIADVLAGMSGGFPEQMCAVPEDVCITPMYVLSNEQKLNGAVEILNDRAMERAAETIGGDFYILPSSIHETILIPVIGNEDDVNGLAAMVSCVNRTEVADIEVLSDHVYRYRSQCKKIEFAA